MSYLFIYLFIYFFSEGISKNLLLVWLHVSRVLYLINFSIKFNFNLDSWGGGEG